MLFADWDPVVEDSHHNSVPEQRTLVDTVVDRDWAVQLDYSDNRNLPF